MSTNIFNPLFEKISVDDIAAEVRNKGFFAFEEAILPGYVDELLQQIDFNQMLLNTNDVGVVIAEDMKFMTHCLASSRKAYDIITHDIILGICRSSFKETFKLTNHRVYQTSKNQHMPWHTDNNRQEGTELSGKHLMPGLLFLVYLSDVEKNAFQLIRGSHKWSEKHNDEIYLSDAFIDKNYKDDILTFTMKKGSLIVSDINTIHRAQPFHDKKYVRTTLLFQVDQVGENNSGHGEKNLVNTEYLDNLSPDVMDYLGFGFKRDYPAFPNSSIATMKFGDIINLQKQLFPKTISGITKKVVKTIVPPQVITNAKRLRWHLKSRKSS